MKFKNIFFVICASMIFVSEISAMQLVVRRVPRAMHRVNNPVLYKRYLDSPSVADAMEHIIELSIFAGKFGIALTILGGCCAIPVMTGWLVFGKTGDVIKDMVWQDAFTYVNQDDECGKAYRIKSLCTDCICSKDGNEVKFLENIDKKWQSRLACLQELHAKHNQCCLVEDDKADAFWFESKSNQNIDLAKYRDEFELVAHRKQCLYDAVILIKRDMLSFQEKAEEIYAERLQLTSVSDEVKKRVKEQYKIDEMNIMIEEIVQKHHSSQKKIPQFKLLNNSQQMAKE